jgi:hypothetical protein
MAADWYWSRGQERFGPVTPAEMVASIRNGTVLGTDLVWTESMTEWKPAASVPSVAKHLPGASPGPAYGGAPAMAPALAPMAVEPASPVAVGYYNPADSLPPRAAATLRGFAPPTGDVAEWPLDDMRVAQYREAYKLRQAVLSSANLYKLGFALTLLSAVVELIAAMVDFGSGRRSQQQQAVGLLVALVFAIGFCVLYGIAWKATIKCRRWAPITMTVLLSISVAVMLVGFVAGAAAASSRDAAPAFFGLVIVLAIGGAFIYVSSKAISAIPKYLAMPAWCQELLATKTM